MASSTPMNMGRGAGTSTGVVLDDDDDAPTQPLDDFDDFNETVNSAFGTVARDSQNDNKRPQPSYS